MFLSLIFLTIQLGFALFLFFLCLAFLTGAPFVPSTRQTAEAMIKLAQLKKGMRIYDLGSGEGRLLKLAAKAGAQAIGFEINPFLVLFTKIRFYFSPYRKLIKVHWSNFWKADFSDADVVFVYLLPWRMEKLEQFLKRELKPGTKVISNSFIFPNLKKITEDRKSHVYVFRI